jgi:predicted MFS family arabinose efflux permease
MTIIAPNDTIAKRNVIILIMLQATIGCMIPVHFLLGGLAGKTIASSPALATLPISMTIIGGMLSTSIITRNMTKFGRQPAFAVATLVAVIGCLIAAYGIQTAQFLFLCLGSMLIGSFMSAQGLYRFAATDMASPEFRSRAISFSILGGLAAAIAGPTLAGKFSVPNLATPYLIVAAITVVMTAGYFLLQLPKPERGPKAATIPLREILTSSKVRAAMLISITSYAMMNLMMTSTPLAVEGCGFSRLDSAGVVRAHVIAMFAPSFFTGYLIKWFGLNRVVYAGLIIMVLASLVALSGVQMSNFYGALILVGIGWNFGFIGGTNMLANALTDPAASKRLQGINDTIMWSCVAVASLSSGLLMNLLGDGAREGWNYVNYAMLPCLIIAMVWGGLLMRKSEN